MKIPKITQLPSGAWHCQLRMQDATGKAVSISITDYDRKVVEAKAASYKSGITDIKKAPDITLRQAIDRYIEDKSNVLSPSTIRGYRTIQRNQFKSIMDKPVSSVRNWQRVVNGEAALYSPKTLRNALGLVKSSLAYAGISLPPLTLPPKVASEKEFLDFEQIRVFVGAVKDENFAVPALLALMSMRVSEIAALQWSDIKEDSVRTHGAVVRNEHQKYVRKASGKTAASARVVPILIPELKAAIERDRSDGAVMQMTPKMLRYRINKLCRDNDLPEVGIHGLRHSFASLAHHIGMPERIAMQIGGWSDPGTMHKIYEHLAKQDIAKYSKMMEDFYAHK